MTNLSKNKLKILNAVFNTFKGDLLTYIYSFEGQSYDGTNPQPNFKKDIRNMVDELKKVMLSIIEELQSKND